MAQYQRIEYRIGKDGKIKETVIDGSGASCTEATAPIESALGEVENKELLPEYYQDSENVEINNTQISQQGDIG